MVFLLNSTMTWTTVTLVSFQILVNAHLRLILLRTRTITTIVTLTPTAPTPRDRSTARVTRGTLEMESRAWVSVQVTFDKMRYVNILFAVHAPFSFVRHAYACLAFCLIRRSLIGSSSIP